MPADDPNQDDPELLDPVDTELDPEGDEEVLDPAGEPEGDEPEDLAANLQPGTPPQPSRREDRIRTLVDENRRKDSELQETRRRLDELTQRVVNPPQQRETPEQRAARLSLMAPEDRLREEFRESQAQHTSEMRQMAFRLADQNDKSAYLTRASTNAAYKRHEAAVEAKLAEIRSQGGNIAREEILKWILGDKMLQQMDSPKTRRQQAAAAQRVANAQTRPADTRSDVQPDRRRQQESLEKRLENVQI